MTRRWETYRPAMFGTLDVLDSAAGTRDLGQRIMRHHVLSVNRLEVECGQGRG